MDIVGSPIWHEAIPAADTATPANPAMVNDRMQLVQDSAAFLAEMKALSFLHTVTADLEFTDGTADASLYDFAETFTLNVDSYVHITCNVSAVAFPSGTTSLWAISIAALDSTFGEIQGQTDYQRVSQLQFNGTGVFELTAGTYRFALLSRRDDSTASHMVFPGDGGLNTTIVAAASFLPKRGT